MPECPADSVYWVRRSHGRIPDERAEGITDTGAKQCGRAGEQLARVVELDGQVAIAKADGEDAESWQEK